MQVMCDDFTARPAFVNIPGKGDCDLAPQFVLTPKPLLWLKRDGMCIACKFKGWMNMEMYWPNGTPPIIAARYEAYMVVDRACYLMEFASMAEFIRSI